MTLNTLQQWNPLEYHQSGKNKEGKVSTEHHGSEQDKSQPQEQNPLEHHQPGRNRNRPSEHHGSGNRNNKNRPSEHHGSGNRNSKNGPFEHHKSGKRNNKNRPPEHHRSGKELCNSSFEQAESEQKKNLQGVPVEYYDFADVFDLKKARIMPRDRGIWNFKIEFIEGWEDKLPRVAKRY